MTHQNHPHLPFCIPGQKQKGIAKQSKDNTDKTKRERYREREREREMKRHDTKKHEM